MPRLEPVTMEDRTVRQDDAVFSYRLLRERRRSLVLRIETSGLAAHAPLSMSIAAVEEFILAKRRWIEKHLARQDKARDWAAQFEFRHGGRFLFRGRPTGLLLGADKTTLVTRSGQAVLRAALPRDASPGRIRGFLRGWLAAQAARTFPGRAAALAKKAGDAPSAIHLSDAVSYWGQCDSRGVIRLSWRLVLFPEAVSDYVIAHELAHLSHMDHSARFWAHVAEIDPDYREHEAQLKLIRIKEAPV